MVPSGVDVRVKSPSCWVLAMAVACSEGCMAVTPQLPPTDFAALERLERREDRDHAYAQNTIRVFEEPQGRRYGKGTAVADEKHSWQSLDAVLRSDQYASEALPYRPLRLARVFTALTIVASIVTVAGAAASAREGLSLHDLDGPSSMLLFGGIATAGLAITAGLFYGRARRGYESAVSIYNESLGMRLGVLDAEGEYIPPPGVLVDREGYIVVDDPAAESGAPPSAAPGQNRADPSVAPPADVPPAESSPDVETTPLEPSHPVTPPPGQVLKLTSLRTTH